MKVAHFPPKEDISPLFFKGGFRGNVNTLKRYLNIIDEEVANC